MNDTLNTSKIINTGDLIVMGNSSLASLDVGKSNINICDINNLNVSDILTASNIDAASGTFLRSIIATGITSNSGLTVNNGTTNLRDTTVNNLINLGNHDIDGNLTVDGNSKFSKVINLPNYTTQQMNEILDPVDGMFIYNTSIDGLCIYQNNAWNSVSGHVIATSGEYSDLITTKNLVVDNVTITDTVTCPNIESQNLISNSLTTNSARLSNVIIGDDMVNIDSSGNVQILGKLLASDDTTLKSLTVNTNEVIRGNLTVDGNIIVAGQTYESQDYISTSLSIINDDQPNTPVIIQSSGVTHPIMKITHVDTGKNILIDNGCSVSIDGPVNINDKLLVNGDTELINAVMHNVTATSLNTNIITSNDISANNINSNTISATKTFRLPVYSADDITNIDSIDGMLIYNSTTKSLWGYLNDEWVSITNVINANTGSFTSLATNNANIDTAQLRTVNVQENVNINGNINVADVESNKVRSSDVEIKNELSVSGKTTLNDVTSGQNTITSMINTGNEFIIGTLNVSGISCLDKVTCNDICMSSFTNTGSAKIIGEFEVNKFVATDLSIMKDIKCEKISATSCKYIGNQDITGNLFVSGISSFGKINAGATTIGGSLNVTGNTTLNTLTCSTFNSSSISSNGDANINGDLNVSGFSTFKHGLTLPNYSTDQMNALDPQNGMLIYNVTENKVFGYHNGAWNFVGNEKLKWENKIKTISGNNLFNSIPQTLSIKELATHIDKNITPKLVPQFVANTYALFTSIKNNKVFVYTNDSGSWRFSSIITTDYIFNKIKCNENNVFILSSQNLNGSGNSSIKHYTYENGKLIFNNNITSSRVGYSQLTLDLQELYSSFTLSFWINTNGTLTANCDKNIISFDGLKIYQKTDLSGSPNIAILNDDNYVELGVNNIWHHYFVQYDGSNLYVYLDDALKMKIPFNNVVGNIMTIGGNLDYAIAGILFDDSIEYSVDNLTHSTTTPLVYLNSSASIFYQNKGRGKDFSQIGTLLDVTGPGELFGVLNQIMTGTLYGFNYNNNMISYLSMINSKTYVNLHWFNNKTKSWMFIARNQIILTNNIKHSKTYILSDPLQLCIFDISPTIGGINQLRFMNIIYDGINMPKINEYVSHTLDLLEISPIDNYTNSSVLYDSTQSYLHILCPNASCGGTYRGGMSSYKYMNQTWKLIGNYELSEHDKDFSCIDGHVFNNNLITLSATNKIRQWILTKTLAEPFLSITCESEFSLDTKTLNNWGKIALSKDGSILSYYLNNSNDYEYLHFYTRSNNLAKNIEYLDTNKNIQINGNLELNGSLKLPILNYDELNEIDNGTLFIDKHENAVKILLNDKWNYLQLGCTKGDGIDYGYIPNSGDLSLSGKLSNVSAITTNSNTIKLPHMPFDEVTVSYDGINDRLIEVSMQTNYLANLYSVAIIKNNIGQYTFSFTPSGFGSRQFDNIYLMNISVISGFNRVVFDSKNNGLVINVNIVNLREEVCDTVGHFTFRIRNANQNCNL